MTISSGTLALIAGVGVLAYVGSKNSPASLTAQRQLLQQRQQGVMQYAQIAQRGQLYRAGGNIISNLANSLFGSGGSRGGFSPSYGGSGYGNNYGQSASYDYNSGGGSGGGFQNASYQYSDYGSPNYSYA